MAYYKILGETLKAIADSIRSKTGKTGSILSGDMSKEIDSIVTPNGTKEITENGTFDITAYASVAVNVPAPVLTYYDGTVIIIEGN